MALCIDCEGVAVVVGILERRTNKEQVAIHVAKMRQTHRVGGHFVTLRSVDDSGGTRLSGNTHTLEVAVHP